MRILFVCGAGYVYGKELLTLSLMKELRDRKHEVMCVVSSWSDGEFQKLLQRESLPYLSIPLGFVSKTLSRSAVLMTLDQVRRLPSLWFKYRKVLREFKPEFVVHTNFHHLVMLWPILGSSKNVFHVHDCFPSTKFYRFVLRLLERKLRIFIGVSRFVAESLVDLGISKAKVTHVLNGICTPQKNGNRGEVMDRPRSKDPVAIGIVGQVGQWKGHDDLVEALRLIKSRNEPFTCKIFGDGNPSYSADLKNKIDSFGLTSQVEWKGFVEDTASIYSLIDLCVVPSTAFETFGMVAAEASLHGIPVVATRRGALPEIVLDHETGYLVDAGSSEQLAEKLQLLLGSENLRFTMGAAARKHALQNLTSARMVQEFEATLTLQL